MTRTIEKPADANALAEQWGLGEPQRAAGVIGRIEDLPAVGALLDPVPYIREPELPEGAVIGLTGDSGSGKSTVATAWARDAIATGRAVLILDRESPRIVAVDRMKRLGLQDGPRLRWAGGWTGQELGLEAPMVDTWVNASDPKPLIILDCLAAFLDGDENSASDMRAFMHRPRRLADKGATVIVIHHDGKAESAKNFRGSSDFKAAVDQAFHVTNLGSDSRLDRIRLRCFKSRFGFCGDILYRYADGEFVRDERPVQQSVTDTDKLTALLLQNSGINGATFESKAVKAGIGRNRAREFLSAGVMGGSIEQKAGAQNAKTYALKGVANE